MKSSRIVPQWQVSRGPVARASVGIERLGSSYGKFSRDKAGAMASHALEVTAAGAFVQSLALTMVSEIGDRTWFMAAVLSTRHSAFVVFLGSWSALVGMTMLSSVMGAGGGHLLSERPALVHWLSVALFAYFGARMLMEASEASKGVSSELEEVERELSGQRARRREGLWQVLSQTLVLTFAAEWGDKSQISTIALAAKEEPVGVVLGGMVGHFLCTGIAVIGGKLLARRISERFMLSCGGISFLVLALRGVAVGIAE